MDARQDPAVVLATPGVQGAGAEAHDDGHAQQERERDEDLRERGHHHDPLAHFGQGRNRVLCGGGFADSAFTVDGALTQFFSHDVLLRWVGMLDAM